jgi:hypothetical protein
MPDTYCPSAQLTVTHTLSAVAPTVIEDFPAAQEMHPLELLTPTALEYLPAAQFLHARKFVAATVFEYEPIQQSAQDDRELLVVYLPVGHAGHSDIPVAAA